MVGSPIGGFMPIPLAMMIPFMAAQSMVMGDAFGRAYQYGKRKISAMTNEEFNALTTSDMMKDILKQYENIIPPLEVAIGESTELQKTIVDEMLQMIPRIAGGLIGDVIDTAEEIIKTGKEVPGKAGGGPPSQPKIEQTQQDAEMAQLQKLYRTFIDRAYDLSRAKQGKPSNTGSHAYQVWSLNVRRKDALFQAAGKNYASMKTKFEIKYNRAYIPIPYKR